MSVDENSKKPPVTNRGVGNTSQTGLSACLDWVQVTLKKFHNAKKILGLFGLSEEHFSQTEGGLYGWNYTLKTAENDIRILYDEDKNEKGCHVIFTGKGCRFFEKNSSTNWVDVFRVLQNTDINVKRIDLAVDDFTGFYNPSKLYRKIKQGSVTSKFRRGRWIESFTIQDYQKGGTTLYMGSPKSDIQVRVYDKLLERKEKGFLVDKQVNHWVRTEIQLRDARAEGLSLMIAYDSKSVGSLAVGILRNYVNFLIPNKSESNKSRWKSCKWWLDFLGECEEISLTLNHSEPVLERTIDWANSQWLKSMYSIYMVFQQDIDIFYRLMEQGQLKMEKKDYKRIEDFISRYGEMTFQDYLEKKKKESISSDTDPLI